MPPLASDVPQEFHSTHTEARDAKFPSSPVPKLPSKKKGVQFVETVRLIWIPEFSEKERADLFYDETDWHRMKTDTVSTIKAMKKMKKVPINRDDVVDEEQLHNINDVLCLRGLESLRSQHHLNTKRRFQSLVTEAVLNEQDRMDLVYHEIDLAEREQRLAHLVRRMSQDARRIAQAKAAADEAVAKQYHAEGSQ